jgi:membrane protein YqaA with SNARE-associated domain
MGPFSAAFRFFLTWWGLYVLGVLDASMVFFLPFGIDALVIYLSARHSMLFWVYPLLAATGSLTGAAVTYWIGRKGGELGLERLVPRGRLARFQKRLQRGGAAAMAVPALLPPPFPLTPFVLTCGALQANPWIFFGTFAVMRLIRFAGEAVLARIYGGSVLRVLESDAFQRIVVGFIVVAIAGTIFSAIMLWRSTRQPGFRPA